MKADLFSEVLVRSRRRGVQIFLTGSSAILQVLTSMSVTHSVSNAASKHAPGMLFPANQRSIKRVIMLNFSVERRIDCQLGCCIGTWHVRSLPISRISWYMLVCTSGGLALSKSLCLRQEDRCHSERPNRSIRAVRSVRQSLVLPRMATGHQGWSLHMENPMWQNISKYQLANVSVILIIMIIMIIMYHYCIIISIIS